MPSSNYPRSILVNDPNKVITSLPDTNHTDLGLWGQIQQNSSGPYHGHIDPFESQIEKLQKQLDDQALNIMLMRLKILSLEGKFDKEELTNLRKMIMSEDEAARTLAESIIENA